MDFSLCLQLIPTSLVVSSGFYSMEKGDEDLSPPLYLLVDVSIVWDATETISFTNVS